MSGFPLPFRVPSVCLCAQIEVSRASLPLSLSEMPSWRIPPDATLSGVRYLYQLTATDYLPLWCQLVGVEQWRDREGWNHMHLWFELGPLWLIPGDREMQTLLVAAEPWWMYRL